MTHVFPVLSAKKMSKLFTLQQFFWFLIPDCRRLFVISELMMNGSRLPPVAYPELVSRGFPKFANLSGWRRSVPQAPNLKKNLGRGGGVPGNQKKTWIHHWPPHVTSRWHTTFELLWCDSDSKMIYQNTNKCQAVRGHLHFVCSLP